MLPDPFNAPVDVAGGTQTTVPLTMTSFTGQQVTRANFSAAAGEPRVVKISHTVVGKGASARDRHLVRMEAYVTTDGVEDTAKPVAVYAVADIPKQGVSSAQITALFQQFVGLLRGAGGDSANAGSQSVFWNRWLGGES